ncbi:MAG: hypothetical protein Q9215_002660 [Flavoplaca cf. flavocitrina]
MDLEYVKVVSQWKIHDDIPVKTFAPEKVNKFATCLSTHVENPFSHGFHTLLLPRFILLQLSSKPPIAATSSSSCAAGYVESLGGRHGGRECRSGGKGPRKKCAPTHRLRVEISFILSCIVFIGDGPLDVLGLGCTITSLITNSVGALVGVGPITSVPWLYVYCSVEAKDISPDQGGSWKVPAWHAAQWLDDVEKELDQNAVKRRIQAREKLGKKLAASQAINMNLTHLLDFDLYPAPTPGSISPITPRELESLKSSFLSQISSLRATLNGKEAEVNSLEEAVDDAEMTGKGRSAINEGRRKFTSRERRWQARNKEMQGVLRSIKEKISHEQHEHEKLQSIRKIARFQDC